jgi:hypothetical protein
MILFVTSIGEKDREEGDREYIEGGVPDARQYVRNKKQS